MSQPLNPPGDLRPAQQVMGELNEFLATPQVNQRSSIGPAAETADAGCLCNTCYRVFLCVWNLLGNLWDFLVRIFCPTRPDSPESAALRERSRELDAQHAEFRRRTDESQAQRAERTKIADDIVPFNTRFAQIEGQIDLWKTIAKNTKDPL